MIEIINISYIVVGFDFNDKTHTETVICGDIEDFHSFMASCGYPHFDDARKIRASDSMESDRWYHAFNGWKRGVPNV